VWARGVLGLLLFPLLGVVQKKVYLRDEMLFIRKTSTKLCEDFSFVGRHKNGCDFYPGEVAGEDERCQLKGMDCCPCEVLGMTTITGV
jgi:hypothetical protein